MPEISIGLVFNYTGPSYYEVVFSPTGVARLNRFQNGRVTTLASASYGGSEDVGFEVALEFGPEHNAVIVNGERLFVDVVTPDQTAAGRLGLITHWSHGAFDNIQFHRGATKPCSFTFHNPPPARWIVSGVWNTNGGTLNNTTLGSPDIVDFKCPINDAGDETANDFTLRARVLNPHAGAGNLVGVVLNYQEPGTFYAGDYYEISFSGANTVEVHKVINGVHRVRGIAPFTVPRGTFFDVEVQRFGVWAWVKVNGTDLFSNGLLLGPLSGGSVGVITHFAKGRFDNVSLSSVGRGSSQLP